MRPQSLKGSLLESQEDVWTLPSSLYSNGRTRGSYHPMRFVLRLQPEVRRALDPDNRHRYPMADRIQAFSTYLHETIHWWQHCGSTLGLTLSLLHPAQMHLNKSILNRVVQHSGLFKSLRRYDEITGRGQSEDINVVLNNWHDIELFKNLVCDPRFAKRYVTDPYFNGVGHTFHLGISAVLWLLSATFDPQLEAIPDPRQWEPELRRLRDAREQGFHHQSDIYLAPLGARALFEAQARFSQIQYLYTASGGQLTWDDFSNGGLLGGIYREAFDDFLKIIGAQWPHSPADPLVGLFLLVCDLAINPSDGFPCGIAYVPAMIVSIDPGMRFLMMCQWLAQRGRSLLGAIRQHSKEEYLEVSEALCRAIVSESPAQIGATVRSWARDHTAFRQVLTEEEIFRFSSGNVPVRIFFARFLRLQLDKLEFPNFFCWPGVWMGDRSDGWRVESAGELFEHHGALFVDGPDGGVYPRVLAGKSATDVDQTFQQFYAGVVAYELTRQWTVEDGPFDFDFRWLTSKFPRQDVEAWTSGIFEQSFGVRPEGVKVL
jgi:hypothetical protein